MTLQKYSEIHYIDWMEMYKLDTMMTLQKYSEIHYIDWMEMTLDTIDDKNILRYII